MSRSGSVTATLERRGLPGKMADDDLVCPPPVFLAIIRHAVWLYLRFTLSYRDVDCSPSVDWISPTKQCGDGY
jgi:hypothetical protein